MKIVKDTFNKGKIAHVDAALWKIAPHWLFTDFAFIKFITGGSRNYLFATNSVSTLDFNAFCKAIKDACRPLAL